jgi:hypothetical protein
MRAAILFALLAAGCATRACREGTVFLTIAYDATSATADRVDLEIAAAGTSASPSVPHDPGAATGTVEIDFPNGYPSGPIGILLTARKAGAVVGTGMLNEPLSPGCSALSVVVSASGGSDGGKTQDLAGIDLIGLLPDASRPPITLDPGFPKTYAHSDTNMMISTPSFDVPAGRLLVLVVVWGQYGGGGVWPVNPDDATLNWTRQIQEYAKTEYPNAVGVGVWTAWTDVALNGHVVTAVRSNSVMADGLIAVYSLANASQIVGATGGAEWFDNDSGPLAITIDATAGGSWIIGGLLDGNSNPMLHGTQLANTIYDRELNTGNNSLAVARMNVATTGPGSYTIGQQSVNLPYMVMAGIEILQQ